MSVSYQFWFNTPCFIFRLLQLKKKNSDDYDKIWNIPLCVRATDNEHIVIEAPTSSGSEFFSCKRTFSIALFGIADVTYTFLYVNVGSNRPETLDVEPEEEVDTDEKGPYILQVKWKKPSRKWGIRWWCTWRCAQIIGRRWFENNDESD